MAVPLFALIVVVGFLALLLVGRNQIAKGANAAVANGSVLLVLAVIVGVLALGMVLSFDSW